MTNLDTLTVLFLLAGGLAGLFFILGLVTVLVEKFVLKTKNNKNGWS
jgi:hypothetical protein